MQIVCPSCGKRLQLPPEKIPPRRFSFACPKCGKPITADPGATEGSQAPDSQPPASEAPVDIAEAQAQPGAGGVIAPGLPLRAADRALLATASTTALVVSLDLPPDPQVVQGLRQIGMEEIQELSDLETAMETLHTHEAGIVLVRTTKAPPPPCEPLEPVHRLAPEVRRRVFVALMADNVSSLNGQVAFLLQMNCLIASQDLPRMPQLVLRALLHHLRLYRHWDLDAD